MDVGKGREQDALSFVRSSQDRQYSFIRTPRTNVSEAALSVQMFIGIGISSENLENTGLSWMNLKGMPTAGILYKQS